MATRTPYRQDMSPRRRSVALVVYDGVTAFDLGVACEVFGDDRSTLFGVPWYRLFICAAERGTVLAHNAFPLQVSHTLDILKSVDTIIVPPTECLDLVPAEVFSALQSAHSRGQRIVSLCTGAFVLARAGLLDGRRATTHWSDCEALARQFPDVTVDPGVLYVDGGDVLTSAGSAASIDLCLHIVRKDFGSEIATQLARQLVVPPQRDGGQAQYIESPLPDINLSSLFPDTLEWLQAHLDQPVTVNALAHRAAMSPRTFARRFVASTGTTPYAWMLRQRVHLAQRLLEQSNLPIELVAEKSGFGTAANLRKHFKSAVHTTPQAYRQTFQPAHAS
jgi:AraC family transcriptional activator FtrA